jgi:hypothetical protein
MEAKVINPEIINDHLSMMMSTGRNPIDRNDEWFIISDN